MKLSQIYDYDDLKKYCSQKHSKVELIPIGTNEYEITHIVYANEFPIGYITKGGDVLVIETYGQTYGDKSTTCILNTLSKNLYTMSIKYFSGVLVNLKNKKVIE